MTLVAHYNFEQSSGALEDVTGNGNDSTSEAVTSRTVTGVLGGNAWDFDGSDDGVTLASFPQFSAYTISFWAYFDNINDGDQDYTVSIRDNQDIQIRERNGAMDFYQDGTNVSSPVSITQGVWQHWSCVWDGSNTSLYRNGVVQSEGSVSTISVSNQSDELGRSTGAGGRYLDGRLDEVRIYDHALTPAEVRYLYDVTQHGQYTSPKL